MTPVTAVVLTIALLLLDAVIIALAMLQKLRHSRRRRRRTAADEHLREVLSTDPLELSGINPGELFTVFTRLSGELSLPDRRVKQIQRYVIESGIPSRYISRLSARFYVTRAEAAFKLKFLHCREVDEALLAALAGERHPVVILHIADALSRHGVRKAIKPLVGKLRGMPPWYAGRIRAVLYTYGKDFLRYAKYRTGNSRIYMQLLLAGFALRYPAEELREFLILRAQSRNPQVRNICQQALLEHFPEELAKEPFASSPSRRTLSYVIRALGKEMKPDHVMQILAYSRKKTLHPYIVKTLSDMAFLDAAILARIYDLFPRARRRIDRSLLASVLANRAEYYLSRINTPMRDQAVRLVRELTTAGHFSTVIDFINRNRDPLIEDALAELLTEAAARRPRLKQQMRQYLKPDILARLKLGSPGRPTVYPRPHTETPKRVTLAAGLILMITSIPLLLFASEFTSIMRMGWREIGLLYAVRFNYLLIFYSLAINGIYLIILFLSFLGGHIQSRLAALKDRRLLFMRDMLPSVSIIAPAYNEAENIIESTNSLLNQHYPDYELIIVNDGSTDDTLARLIDYFDLKKQDMIIHHRLRTRPLRGIYLNRRIPNLIVADKVNGGKADTLNLGLNIASKELFCGIDADSLLDPEALLKAAAVMIDSPHQSIAVGGNIIPVNGCRVDHGTLEEVQLPDRLLPRLQSLEYNRAFMTGRVGWAYINTLMIISGAFGVFNRELTIRTGGYLTKSGKYRQDTVGEDMELVVRLSRYMREKKKPYSVDYALDADCWTEVPETWRALRRQRDRWHRGLIEIILFHRRLIANPRYGRLGTVGMLYYFLFEFIGPFVEVQGLIMVGVSALIGALNLTIAMLLFSTTILLGILVSASSVLIGETQRELYSRKDTARLLGMAVAENFGLRQIISFWRVKAYFSSMQKAKGWGAQSRKGFRKVP